MTELYWQRYRKLISSDPMHSDDQFWKNVKQDIESRNQPKHHLELYSMCKSDNPYIRQVKNSPNITTKTVAELICRDKACQLQYCMSLMKVANENRRRLIDLKGCKEQQNLLWDCIKVQQARVLRTEQELFNEVHGIKVPTVEKEITQPALVQKNKQVYI